MFSKVAGHLACAFQTPPGASLAQPLAATAARRLAPANALWRTVAAGAQRHDTAMAVRARSVSFMAAPPARQRDWPATSDVDDGIEEISTAGTLARRAAVDATPTRAAVHQVREAHAVMRGQGIDPSVSAAITSMCMTMGLERSLDELLATEAPGVAAGLRRLAIAPGDAVGEHDPADPGLAVRLALEGAHTFVALSYPTRYHEISRELDRYRGGTPTGMRQLANDLQPLRPQRHYEQASAEVGRHLRLVQGGGFGALPRESDYKALLSRGVFQYLDALGIDSAVRSAGRMLQPGGGLVFDFAHAAGQPAPAHAGVQLNKIQFSQIEDAVESAGLQLRCLYVTFRSADNPAHQVIPTRRVLTNKAGRIGLCRADAAAWSGWNEIYRQPRLHGQPVLIDVSGLLVKPEK